MEKDTIRNSNLELLRIVTMLLIVSHHYVVNSGISDLYDFSHITGNMIFTQIVGCAGKTGINVFAFITGYFMIKSEIKPIKILKLFLEIMFYNIAIYILFLMTGYEVLDGRRLLEVIFSVAYDINKGFVGTYIMLYLLIPFINKLLLNISKRAHLCLIVILLVMYTVLPSFLIFCETYSSLGWMISVYTIAAFIRLYPHNKFDNWKFWGKMSIATILLSIGSILLVDFIGAKYNFTTYYHFLSYENKILALSNAACFFMFFNSINLKPSKVIERLASTTFGVLLIHANSSCMRQFLWSDLLKNVEWYDSALLPLHWFLSVISVYCICSCIDLLRINLLERPFFNFCKNSRFLMKNCR